MLCCKATLLGYGQANVHQKLLMVTTFLRELLIPTAVQQHCLEKLDARSAHISSLLPQPSLKYTLHLPPPPPRPQTNTTTYHTTRDVPTAGHDDHIARSVRRVDLADLVKVFLLRVCRLGRCTTTVVSFQEPVFTPISLSLLQRVQRRQTTCPVVSTI